VTALDVLLVAMGAFYALAGVVGIKAALSGRMLDVAIAAIEMKPPKRAETTRGAWLLAGAVLVLAGGAALLLRIEWAAPLFALSALMQGVYLGVLAPWYLDPGDPPDQTGRQQTTNAFLIYTAATVLVLWAYKAGALLAPEDVIWPARWLLGALVLAAAGYATWSFLKPLDADPDRHHAPIVSSAERSGDDDGEVMDELRERPAHHAQSIALLPEYQCDPLWAHEPGLHGTISPRDLPLSEALIGDLEAWAEDYNGSFNTEDFANPHWSDAQYRDHRQRGVALARRLKGELPTRQIYIYDPDSGHIEITESDVE
jgi:hypothetical protein